MRSFLVTAEQLGLTPGEYATVVQAHEAVRQVCAAAARRELASRRPALLEAVSDAREALQALLDSMTPGDELLGRKRAELAEVERRIAGCTRVDEDTPLDEWVTAEATRGALERRQIELQARIGLIQDNQSPVMQEAARARARADTAQTKLAALDRTVAEPLGTLHGITTTRAGMYWLASGEWLAHITGKGVLPAATLAPPGLGAPRDWSRR